MLQCLPKENLYKSLAPVCMLHTGLDDSSGCSGEGETFSFVALTACHIEDLPLKYFIICQKVLDLFGISGLLETF